MDSSYSLGLIRPGGSGFVHDFRLGETSLTCQSKPASSYFTGENNLSSIFVGNLLLTHQMMLQIRHGEDEVDILMNSKLDHYAPAVGRMVMQREVADRGRGGRGRGGGARRRGQ